MLFDVEFTIDNRSESSQFTKCLTKKKKKKMLDFYRHCKVSCSPYTFMKNQCNTKFARVLRKSGFPDRFVSHISLINWLLGQIYVMSDLKDVQARLQPKFDTQWFEILSLEILS